MSNGTKEMPLNIYGRTRARSRQPAGSGVHFLVQGSGFCGDQAQVVADGDCQVAQGGAGQEVVCDGGGEDGSRYQGHTAEDDEVLQNYYDADQDASHENYRQNKRSAGWI